MSEPLFEKTQRFCERYAEDLKKIFPNVDLHYILHHRGQKAEQIAKLMPKIHGHAAYGEAAALLKFRSPGHDNSAFLGLVIGFRKSLLGFKKHPECLAFISINMNQHETEEDLLFTIHSLTSNFMETVDFYTQKHAGSQNNQILQPKRNNIATARTNLKADVYSVIQMVHNGFIDALTSLGKKRAFDAMTPQVNHPEEYPFPIAIDVTNYALEKFISSEKRSPIGSAYSLAKQVAASFDAKNIETWIMFANAAQTMAWSGYQPAQILEAATEGSSNPFIKATGHLLTEITGVIPDPMDAIAGGHNPFAQQEVNIISHERTIEETFEMVLIHAMEADSHLPMIHVANNQNEGLLKGRFAGWCAHSLQSAALAYHNADRHGMPRDQAARLEFQSAKQHTGWKELSQLGSFITDMNRSGQVVTLSGISKWCENNPQFKPVMESINLTLADPVYARKLEATAEMPVPGPQISLEMQLAASPQLAPQPSPQIAMAPASPSPGGMAGMGGSSISGPTGGIGKMMRTSPQAKTATAPPQTDANLLFEEEKEK
ncbi:MAG TPA: hypothetical protein PKI93_07315 [Alphaproteobacteria bacterium]|nr:hypothetical protein [Alphaproteobacteria bacterium]HNS44063.1 hypothetical protein [Alphaproteobacteria bacterium]